ncbi:unnamed protein product [Phytomonas sp. Hart1]|nr:unnamed protein product [Phytomonas sp. Hart1]|eukprot:CCW70032.1 unnamed protein product [Phytomonas sp. isolate Hart1]
MYGNTILCLGFKPNRLGRILPTFTHSASLACFRRPLVLFSSFESFRFLMYSHAQSRSELVSSYRWASSSGRGSRSTSKPQSTTARKILPLKKKIAKVPLPKVSKTKSKSPKKRTSKRKLTPHQVQAIKYNKRVGAIAKLWDEQEKSLPGEPFT